MKEVGNSRVQIQFNLKHKLELWPVPGIPTVNGDCIGIESQRARFECDDKKMLWTAYMFNFRINVERKV